MTIKLPEAFVERMRALLGAEYEDFAASYDWQRYYGLRSNPLKLNVQELASLLPMKLTPVPWATEGFYYEEGERPGKHPYYHAGLYYIQEPSAMVPVELLDVRPGDRVLDLCAAPGGKTTQLAGKLQGQGVLVANDNSFERVRALTKNVELFGITNAIVMHELPERLAAAWPGYFNKILIDAPCSGEGMFRKEEDMIRQWEKHSVTKCMAMQGPILQAAAVMLAPGGRMVYSTCTFSPEENESMIADFLREHPDFRVVPVPAEHGFTNGHPEWTCAGGEQPDEAARQTAGTIRLWPHRIKGEGHFAAVLEKQESSIHSIPAASKLDERSGHAVSYKEKGKGKQKGKPEPASAATQPDLSAWPQFCRDNLTVELPGTPVLFGEFLYLSPQGSPPLDGLKVFRPGWSAGVLKRGRFEPAHPLALGLTARSAKRVLLLSAGSDTVIRYLKGETLFLDEAEVKRPDGVPAKGYVLVCVDGYPLGWGKFAEGMLKNEYPPGWRWV